MLVSLILSVVLASNTTFAAESVNDTAAAFSQPICVGWFQSQGYGLFSGTWGYSLFCSDQTHKYYKKSGCFSAKCKRKFHDEVQLKIRELGYSELFRTVPGDEYRWQSVYVPNQAYSDALSHSAFGSAFREIRKGKHGYAETWNFEAGGLKTERENGDVAGLGDYQTLNRAADNLGYLPFGKIELPKGFYSLHTNTKKVELLFYVKK
jgi:hypothetical protein